MVVSKMMVVWYQIAKQQLSIIFPYRCWKLIGHEGQALGSKMNDAEQVDVQICNKDDVWDVTVNVEWTMSNLRVYLGLKFDLKGDFTFVVVIAQLCVGRKRIPSFVKACHSLD